MVWISLSLAVVGLVLLVFGVRRWRGRRVGEAPTCGRCEYDLTGLVGGDAPVAVCPECGGDLREPGAVRKGPRKIRGRTGMIVAVVGAGMFVAGMSMGGNQAWNWSQAYNWNKVKPVWLLHRQARDSKAVGGVVVLDELILRLEADRLSARAVKPIIDTALERQADLAIPWNRQWGDFVSGASKRELVTDSQEDRYLAGVIVLGSAVRPWVYPGEPVPVSFSIAELRCSGAERFYAHITIKDAQIGEKELRYRPFFGGLSIGLMGWRLPKGTWGLLGSGSRGGSLNRYLSDPTETRHSSQVSAPDELGRAQVGLTWQIMIERDDDGDRSIRAGHLSIDEEGVAAADQHHVLDFEIVEPSTHAIRTRPGNDGIVLTADKPRLERFRNGNASARGMLTFEGVDGSGGYDLVWILPVDVAEAWQTDREWIVGSRIFVDDGSSGVSTFGYNSAGLTLPERKIDEGWLDGVQIVLRPSARISRTTVDIMEIPSETTDLGIHRVPVIDNRRR